MTDGARLLKPETGAFILVLIVAAVLRFCDLTESFHLDDYWDVTRARPPLPELFNGLARESYLEPPASHLLVKPALLLSESEWVTRLPSVFASIAGVGLVYLLGRRLFSPAVGLMAAAIVAVAPSDIRYAQDVRYWSEFSAVHLASVVLLVWALQRNESRLWVAYSIVLMLGLYLNPTTPVVLALQAGLGLVLVLMKARYGLQVETLPISWDRLRRLLVAIGAAFAAFLPWVAFLGVHRLTQEVSGERWRGAIEYDLTPNPAFSPEPANWLFTNGSGISPLVWLFYALIAIALIASVRKRQLVPLLLTGYALAFLPILIIGSQWISTFLPTRRIVFLLPLFAVAAAVGIQYLAEWVSSLAKQWRFIPSAEKERMARVAGRAVLVGTTVLAVALSVPPTLSYYESERADFRGVGEFLRENVAPSDVVVLAPMHQEAYWVIRYYLGDGLAARSMTVEEFTHDEKQFDERGSLSESMRVWWVTEFPPSGERYTVLAFNSPSRVQRVAGARGLSWVGLSMFVAYEDLPSPLTPRAIKLAALVLVLEQANTPQPMLPAERDMADRLGRSLSEELIEELDLRDGFLIAGSGPDVFMMEEGKRRHVARDLLEECGYDRNSIYRVEDELLESIPGGERVAGPPCPEQITAVEALGLSDGSIVRRERSGTVFIVEGGKKRPFATPEAFKRCGYDFGSVQVVADAPLAMLPDGEPVTGSPCPKPIRGRS